MRNDQLPNPAEEDDPDPEAFGAICRQAGLVLDDSELTTMREGYLGLRHMIASLPSVDDVSLEPAFVATLANENDPATR
jgi:hypothetical protein